MHAARTGVGGKATSGKADFAVTYFVYLNNGAVTEVVAAEGGCCLTTTELVFLLNGQVAKSFPRSNVYFASLRRIAPPVLF